MFDEISEKHKGYAEILENTYEQSKKAGLTPRKLKYRSLNEKDFENIFSIVDMVQATLNYDHISGGCLYVHTLLKEALSKRGYLSEVIFGDVLINNDAHMGCDLVDLKEQLNIGVDNKEQKVHCWLMLENYQFFDATLYRDFTDGVYAAEIYGYGHNELDGDSFHYKPMLAGSDFIEKTNPIHELAM